MGAAPRAQISPAGVSIVAPCHGRIAVPFCTSFVEPPITANYLPQSFNTLCEETATEVKAIPDSVHTECATVPPASRIGMKTTIGFQRDEGPRPGERLQRSPERQAKSASPGCGVGLGLDRVRCRPATSGVGGMAVHADNFSWLLLSVLAWPGCAVFQCGCQHHGKVLRAKWFGADFPVMPP